MSLTKETMAILQRPFALKEHEFKPPNNFVYVAEEAVTRRLEEVDPAWGLSVLNVYVRDRVAVATISLSLLGVVRQGVGMQTIELSKDGTREVNEAEKGAATDALRRAARLFGVGRYLLDAPNDKAQFGTWLGKLSGGAAPNPPAPPPTLPGGGVAENKPWTQDEMAAFWQAWTEKAAWKRDDILMTLGVMRLGDWRGSAAEADKAMHAAADALAKNGARA